ncbi:MAG: carboxymuconolactone decarboxylase family protein [Chloroflexota bacterium]
MDYLPEIYKEFQRHHPELSEAYGELAGRCLKAGPLDEKTAELVKLGIAVGLNSEGAVRSHARRALAGGASKDEVRHAVLLAMTTAGFPAMIAAMGWLNEVLDRRG